MIRFESKACKPLLFRSLKRTTYLCSRNYSEGMRIFVLLSRIPWPLEKGDKLRAFHQIRCLSESNEIILCALNSDRHADKQQAYRALQPYCKSVTFIDLPGSAILVNLFKAFITGRPLQTGYFFNRKARKKVEELISRHQPSILFGQLLRVAEYVRKSKLPKVLDYQDVFSVGMQRREKLAPFFLKPFFRMEFKRLAQYEAEIFQDFDLKTIISLPDRSLVPHPGRDQILIIPNGVDHEYFKPAEMHKDFDIVFTGNMAYPPNIDAAVYLVEKIMPEVWLKFPQARVLIAGATPDKQVQNLQQQKVKVSGWMDDIRLAYAGSAIFVAPMRLGTGLQNKLLEAMSMQLPCVTTPLANEPLKAVAGKQILVGDSSTSIAGCIVQLLDNPTVALEIARQGHQFVQENYHWESATKQLERAMQALVDEGCA